PDRAAAAGAGGMVVSGNRGRNRIISARGQAQDPPGAAQVSGVAHARGKNSGDRKMKITHDVIRDLLPVYFSGEASADTKTLVEEFLRQNPEFSNQVEAQKHEFNAQHDLLEAAGAPSADHELRTLARTRSLMERQKWSLGLALAFTLF